MQNDFCFSLIYDKIDSNNDGFVSEEELIEWIKHVQNRYIEKDTARQWNEHEIEGDLLDWKVYKQRTYGFEDGKFISRSHCYMLHIVQI